MIIDRREQNKVLKPIDQNYTKKVVEQTSHLSYFIKNTLVSSTKKVTTECESDACCWLTHIKQTLSMQLQAS